MKCLICRFLSGFKGLSFVFQIRRNCLSLWGFVKYLFAFKIDESTLAWRRCWVVAMGANDMVLSDRVEKYSLGKLIDRETC